MKRGVFIIWAIMALVSCNKTAYIQYASDSCEIIDISQAVSNSEIESFNDYVEEVRVVRLETNDSCFISLINELIITDDRIIVFDNGNKYHQVLIFDKEGHFVNAIKRGQGPTEIVKAFHIAYDYDKEEIIASQHSLQSYFNKNGEYIKSIKNNILFGEFVKYRDEFVLKVLNVHKEGNIGDYGNYEIIVTDSLYNVKSCGLQFYNDLSLVSDRSLFVTNDGVLITRMLNDTIFRYTNGGLSPAYLLQYPNKKYNTIPQNNEELSDSEEQSGYCFYGSFEPSTTHQCLCLDNDADNIYIYAIRNTKTNNIILRKVHREQFFVGNRFFVIPSTTYKDNYVTVINAEEVADKRENIKSAFPPEELKKLDEMDEEDNPAIVFYKFKDF